MQQLTMFLDVMPGEYKPTDVVAESADFTIPVSSYSVFRQLLVTMPLLWFSTWLS
jgi:hypothetical protein